MLKITDTFQQSLLEVYGEKENSCERFMALTKKYKEYFHMEEPEYFTSPGRMELIGNHTDHNGGKHTDGYDSGCRAEPDRNGNYFK